MVFRSPTHSLGRGRGRDVDPPAANTRSAIERRRLLQLGSDTGSIKPGVQPTSENTAAAASHARSVNHIEGKVDGAPSTANERVLDSIRNAILDDESQPDENPATDMSYAGAAALPDELNPGMDDDQPGEGDVLEELRRISLGPYAPPTPAPPPLPSKGAIPKHPALNRLSAPATSQQDPATPGASDPAIRAEVIRLRAELMRYKRDLAEYMELNHALHTSAPAAPHPPAKVQHQPLPAHIPLQDQANAYRAEDHHYNDYPLPRASREDAPGFGMSARFPSPDHPAPSRDHNGSSREYLDSFIQGPAWAGEPSAYDGRPYRQPMYGRKSVLCFRKT